MKYNEGYDVDIIPLTPQGTNSTFFTACCSVAICDDQPNCPVCKRKVVGWEEKTDARRNSMRWKNATRFWKR